METNESKQVGHTQGEWGLEGTNILTPNRLIANCIGNRASVTNEDKANAKRIVKCVNMHDELVINLKRLVERLEENELGELVAVKWAKNLLKQAEQK